MKCFDKSAKTGFSLVELLVVIAIISVLMSMLLPAVQRVREASQTLKCTNNLHQLGIAYHLYHDRYGQLPGGAWISRVLGCLENIPSYSSGIGMNQNVPILNCPSRSLTGNIRLDYCGMRYLTPAFPTTITDSALNAGRLADITDGTSNTIWLAEKYMPRGSLGLPAHFSPTGEIQIHDAWGITQNVFRISQTENQEWGRIPDSDSAQIDGSVPDVRDTQTVAAGTPPSSPTIKMEPTVGFMYGSPTQPVYFFWMLNLTPAPVTVTRFNPAPGRTFGFGSSHTGSMNVLMCDSSARKFRYGATGLTQLLNKTDGVVAFD